MEWETDDDIEECLIANLPVCGAISFPESLLVERH
jgi:hypothetical protein